MRERLTLSFVVVTLVLLALALSVRAVTVDSLVREREGEHIFREASTLAVVVDSRAASGQAVDEAFLRGYVGADTVIEVRPPGGAPVTVRGASYAGGDDAISSTIDLQDGGQLSVRQSSDPVALWGESAWSLAVLFLLVGVLAAVVGFVIARSLSAPFQRLALAAGALGRGRFDLDLPDSRVPEARAISEALGSSAVALRDRLEREQQFAMHASHVLRTPLTSLRMQLEEMTLDPDLPAGARAAADRCVRAVDEVNVVAGDLVDLARQGPIGGSQVPLRDLATSCVQRWSDELTEHGRAVTAAVEGDIELTLTPGPVEQVLDLLLRDVVRHGRGDARLVFVGDTGGHLRIVVRCARRAAGGELVDDARAVVEALGGRLQPGAEEELVLLLPRR